MAEKYYIDFVNHSGRTWTMAAYQTLPDSVGLVSVSWLQTTAADGGESGVSWEVDYLAMLGNYKQEGGKGVYKTAQKKTTALGKRWKIVYKEGLQQLVEDGAADRPDQIYIFNDSGEIATPGFGMSGQGAVYKSEVLSGTGAQFVVTPTYWVGLFRQVVLGEVISSNVVVGPEKLTFPSGFNLATVTARLDGSTLKMGVTYGRMSAVNMSVVEAHLGSLARLSGGSSELDATSGTLQAGKSHPWEASDRYDHLSFDWAGGAGNGKVSVKIDDAATSYTVPQADIAVNKQAGKLTNNTDKTISYKLW
jgi:rhizosphere induced protein